MCPLKIFLVPVLILIINATTLAQKKGIIKGHLKDSVGNQILSNASIVLLQLPDSSVVHFVISQRDASFTIANIVPGEYALQIKMLGFETWYKQVTISKEAHEVDLRSIFLLLQPHDLGTVTVKDFPVQLVKDTLLFNASSFKTRPYAALEELLRRLPGLQVSPNGVIKVNGEVIQQILVDGKPFFGGDPRIAIKNLPADIIDKIKVYNASDKELTGLEGSNKQKTINVTIKKNKRKGSFGNITTGVGTQETYNTGATMNHFNNAQQLSLLAQANNVNMQDMNEAADRNGGNGMSGINSTLLAGLNYRDTWSKNISAYGSYMFNHQQTQNDQDLNIQNIFPGDSSTFNVQKTNGKSNTDLSRVNFNIEVNLDSFNSLIYRPNISFQKNNSINTQESVLTGKNDTDTIYNSRIHSNISIDQQVEANNLIYRHRFKKKLRLFSANVNINANKNVSNAYNITNTKYISPSISTSGLNQHSINSTNNITYNTELSYTEPIIGNQFIVMSYKYLYQENRALNQTFHFNGITQKYDYIDTLQSNHFENTYQTHHASVNYRLENKRYHLSAEVGLQTDKIRGNNITKDSLLQHRYYNITSLMSAFYNFSETKNIQLTYSGIPSMLSVQQLQPVQTTRDSLYIQQGNTQLKQSYQHNISISYNETGVRNQHFLSLSLNGNITHNTIQNSVTQLLNGIQISKPVNLNGAYNLSASFNYGVPLHSLQSTINFLTNLNYQHTPVLLNGETNKTISSNIGQSVNWQTDIGEKISFFLDAALNYTSVQYNLRRQTIHYFTAQIQGNIFYSLTNWSFGTQFYYIFNNTLPAGFSKTVPLLSPTISSRLFRNRAGELKLAIFDLLNQNVGISKTTTFNTIQDMKSLVRSRYAMLTFTYNIRRFNSK